MKLNINDPVFLFLEILYFFFSITDKSQRHGLHPARGQSIAELFPEERADFIPNKSVEDPSRFLRVIFRFIKNGRRFKRLQNTFLCDLMEEYPCYLLFLPDQLCDMEGYGFSFTIRVGADIYFISSLTCLFQFFDNL